MYFTLHFTKKHLVNTSWQLNLSPIQSRQQHIDAPFLINDFINEIYCSSILDTASLHVSNKTITDLLVFDALHCAEVSPSVRCVHVANAVCRKIDIFNRFGISAKNIIKYNINWFRFVVYILLILHHTRDHCLLSLFINSFCSLHVIPHFCNFLCSSYNHITHKLRFLNHSICIKIFFPHVDTKKLTLLGQNSLTNLPGCILHNGISNSPLTETWTRQWRWLWWGVVAWV